MFDPVSLAARLVLGKKLKKMLPYIAGAVGLMLAAGVPYFLGSSHGRAAVQSQWDKDKSQRLLEEARLKGVVSTLQQQHKTESGKITYALQQASQAHARHIADLDAEYAQRLSVSTQRASKYQLMAQSGAAQCGNLASHAAQLDHTLEEGRRLVKEFRSTLDQRDQQLRLLGQQIVTDRALLGGKDKIDAASAE